MNLGMQRQLVIQVGERPLLGVYASVILGKNAWKDAIGISDVVLGSLVLAMNYKLYMLSNRNELEGPLLAVTALSGIEIPIVYRSYKARLGER